MENIEDFIRKNRDDLDNLEPSPSVWKGIKHGLRRGRPQVFLRLAAAVVIVAVISSAFLYYFRTDNSRAGSQNDAILIKANPQLMETEIYYNSLVNNLYNEAAPILSKNPDIRTELNSDMSQIDSICADIKKDLRDNVSNQEVIEALIRNYRIKIQILEDMIRQLNTNDINNEKNNYHEL